MRTILRALTAPGLGPMRTTLRALTAPSLSGQSAILFARLGPVALAGALWLSPSAQAAPAGAGYTVKAVCAAPAPGYASCLGLRLVPSSGPSTPAAPSARSPGARGASPSLAPPAASPTSSKPRKPGLSPAELHNAYALPLNSAEPQTIALVDAYDDPNAEADLKVFDEQFALPPCTKANGCFTKVNQQGLSAPLPPANGEWSEEIATDIEVAHSLCENCHIVLVEAGSSSFPTEAASFPNLEAAEDTAAAAIAAASKPGALEGEISNSWGGSEPPVDGTAFNHPGIVISASAGDAGYLNWDEYSTRNKKGSGYFEGPDYPAASPNVIAVGGTSLTSNALGEWQSEKVWNNTSGAGGGGCSAVFPAPLWQTRATGWPAVGCSKRAVADVSADADPYTGVHVYDSVPEALGTEEEATNTNVPEWMTIGGTSVASPIIASAFALAGGAHGIAYPAATLYYHAGSTGLHDVAAGGNGECDGAYFAGCSGSLASPLDCGALYTICNAAPGYDGPTGVGTPKGLAAFQPPPAGSPGNPGGGPGEGPGSGEGGKEGPATGGSPTGGGAPAGGAGASGASGGQGSGPPSGSSNPTPGAAKQTAAGGAVRLSRLSLTLSAVAALNRGRPPLSRVAFTFTLSAAAKVRVTLAQRVRVHGHWRWSTLRGSNSIAARAGSNHAHLSGRGALPAGLYRLTLTPVGGAARSLTISIG